MQRDNTDTHGTRGAFGYRQFGSNIEQNYDDTQAINELLDRSVSYRCVNGDPSTTNPPMTVRHRTASKWARRGMQSRFRVQNPDRLMASTFHGPKGRSTTTSDIQRSQIHLPPKLPSWVWNIIAITLGIGSRRKQRMLVGTMIHVFTLLAALAFATSGLFFNTYDAISVRTKTSVIQAVTKSILGIFWICLGVYANSLAARLFNNPKLVECIRLHSKTFLKISSAFIICILCLVVVTTNMYTNRYLLNTHSYTGNTTKRTDVNCADINVNPVLCEVYYGSKVTFSVICVMWNLLVVGIYLSVCRTHTVGLRRFMKELLYDTKIYEEYCKLQSQDEKQHQLETSDPFLEESWAIWDDDITIDSEDVEEMEQSHGAQLLKTVRFMRQNQEDQYAASQRDYSESQDFHSFSTNLDQNSLPPDYHQTQQSTSQRSATITSIEAQAIERMREVSIDTSSLSNRTVDVNNGSNSTLKQLPTKFNGYANPTVQEESEQGFEGISHHGSRTRLTSESTTLVNGDRPPIMRNEDLMYTYFTLLRRLAATSRLLQRWIFSWITFTICWCVMYIIYWINHTASIIGIVEFLVPLLILGLLSSAFAEVNFEGQRLLKCILPTEERLWVIMYFYRIPMELKIFSFTMTYNSIATVIAGVAVTFATRIILDQVDAS